MFCPYVQSAYTRITLISYNGEGNENGSIIHENYINKECRKEQCGAWHKGKCNYKVEEKK